MKQSWLVRSSSIRLVVKAKLAMISEASFAEVVVEEATIFSVLPAPAPE